LWKSFSAEFTAILRNLRAHKELIESQAGLIHFRELIHNQELAKATLERIKVEEIQRQKEIVFQWLSAANCEVDQETYAKVREEYPQSGKWLMSHDRFESWFHPDFCSTPLLWMSGIPGAG
jgi:cell division FtsZ-interacting protein ZapD